MSMLLVEAIRQLREELCASLAKDEAQDVNFVVDKVDLELSVTFTTEAQANGKIKLLTFLDVSGGGRISNQNQHKINISLIVSDKDGKSLRVQSKELPGGL